MTNTIRMRLSAIVCTVLSLSLTFCGDDDDTNGDSPITVGSGTTPGYSWTGGDVKQLTVLRGKVEDGVYAWAIGSDNTPASDTIASPVVHGTVPADAIELTHVYQGASELVLEAGTSYQVWIEWSDGTREFVEFTP